MTIIKIHYDQRTPQVTEEEEVVSGQRQTIAIQFTFSPEWSEFAEKTAVFTSVAAKKSYMLDEDGKVDIPEEVIINGVREFSVSVFGVREGENGEIPRYNGKPTKFSVTRGGDLPGNDTTSDGKPTAYEQLLYKFEVINSKVGGKLDAFQGEDNAYRAMVVGGDGIVRPGDYAGGGSGGITQETDPTVPAWAKQPTKPTYTPSEIGALPASTKIPAKTSDLQNDSGFITTAVASLLNYYLKSETYAKGETYSQTEVDALISGLDRRLSAIADSDDTTLDQLSEIVAYIKANKSMIDSITTSKVSVADIVDNLTTSVANKPLSAAQGVALKKLIDALNTGKLDASELTEAVNTALAQAKESGNFDGATGAAGVGIASITQTASNADGGTNTIDVVLTDGTKYTLTVKNGSAGTPGKNGTDGTSVTVSYVTESTEDGGSNVVTFSDGKKLNVKNGDSGVSPTVSVKESTANAYVLTITDEKGSFTTPNLRGEDGKSGVYVGAGTRPEGTNVQVNPNGEAFELVEIDKTLTKSGYAADAKETGDKLRELSEQADDISTLTLQVHTDGLMYIFKNGVPMGTGVAIVAYNGDVVGNVDSANNIVLSGNLPDGKYTFSFVKEDGTEVKIGELNLTDIVDVLSTYDVNLNQRYSGSSGALTARNGCVAISVPVSDLVGKSIRLDGFEYGMSKSNLKPIWYMVGEGTTITLQGDKTVGFWNNNDDNMVVTAQEDGSYLCTFPSSASQTAYTLWILLILDTGDTALTSADLYNKTIEII